MRFDNPRAKSEARRCCSSRNKLGEWCAVRPMTSSSEHVVTVTVRDNPAALAEMISVASVLAQTRDTTDTDMFAGRVKG